MNGAGGLGGLAFAQPLALGLGALLVPLVVAYLVQRRLRRRAVPSLVLLRAVAGVEPSRSRLRRPTHLVSLALAAVALAAMALGAARPRLGAAGPATIVVLLDTSSSLAAEDERGRRFDRALDELGRLVGRLAPEDRVALLATGPEARLVVGLTRDHDRPLREARALVPAGSNGGLGEALRLGAGFCREPGAELVFITDGAAALIVGDGNPDRVPKPSRDGLGPAEPSLPHASDAIQCPLRVVAVGESAANAGITTFSARAVDGPNLTEVLFRVEAWGGRPRKGLVTLTVDGAAVDAVPLALAPGSGVDRLLRLSLPAGDVLEARLTVDGPDALSHDDRAAAPLPRAGRVRTLLVTDRPHGFTAAALELEPRVDLLVIGGVVSAPATAFDLVVLEAWPAGALPAARRVLALGVDPTRFGVRKRKTVRDPDVVRWAFAHPLMRFVELGDLNVARATVLAPPPGAVPLVEAPEGALALLLDGGGARETVLFGFAPDDSDLPLRVAFANFLSNVVDWAAPWSPAGARLALGEPPPLPDDARLVPLDGGPPLAAGVAPTRPGAFRVERAGRGAGVAVANLVAPGETDVRPRARADASATAASALPGGLAGGGGRRLALAVIALALGCLALEQALPALRRARARRGA